MDKLDANLEQQFDLNLIEAVKLNPVIYDRSHYNYKHFVRKAQTWKQIAETLGVPGKWNSAGFGFCYGFSAFCLQSVPQPANWLILWGSERDGDGAEKRGETSQSTTTENDAKVNGDATQ